MKSARFELDGFFGEMVQEFKGEECFAIVTLKIQCVIPKLSKSIINKIDELLAKYYGFTEEELDFIINYDIKYRMGDELKGEA